MGLLVHNAGVQRAMLLPLAAAAMVCLLSVVMPVVMPVHAHGEPEPSDGAVQA